MYYYHSTEAFPLFMCFKTLFWENEGEVPKKRERISYKRTGNLKLDLKRHVT